MRLIPSSKTDRVAASLLIVGLLLVFAGTVAWDLRVGLKAGGASAALAYWVVLIDNFRARRDVQTRGGVVRAEDGMFHYALPYVFLGLMGVGFVLFVVVA